MKESYFSIGEFSRLSGVTIKTLHHYDKIGLLKPEHLHASSSYRYYSPLQISRISIIKKLQEIGFTLEQISTCFTDKGMTFNTDTFHEIMKDREAELEKEMIHMKKKMGILKEFKVLSKMYNQEDNDNDVKIISLPRRYILYKENHGILDAESIRKIYKDITRVANENQYVINFGFIVNVVDSIKQNQSSINKLGMLVHPTETKIEDTIIELPANDYAIFLFKGNQQDLQQKGYIRIQDWLVKNNQKTAGPIVQYYLINESLTSNEDHYVTQVEIPLIKKTK